MIRWLPQPVILSIITRIDWNLRATLWFDPTHVRGRYCLLPKGRSLTWSMKMEHELNLSTTGARQRTHMPNLTSLLSVRQCSNFAPSSLGNLSESSLCLRQWSHQGHSSNHFQGWMRLLIMVAERLRPNL